MKIRYKKLHPDAVLPIHSKPGDAGVDLTAVKELKDEFGNHIYHFGLAVEIPEGYVGLMFARSSIYKYSLVPTNCVGVIDSGYRGELMMKMRDTHDHFDRLSRKAMRYQRGERVCQLVIVPVAHQETEWADELTATERGEGGYGSTGQ